MVIVITNLLFITADSYSGDIGYWQNWVGQLQLGYGAFKGDYPPGYIHWFYFVGKLYSFFSIPLEVNNFLKFLVQIPVICSHLMLAFLITLWAQRYRTNVVLTQAVLALACFNPAFLVDGPLWGQIDLLPMTIAMGALTLAVFNKRMDLALPLYVLALLVKFQMIALVPVFALLGLQQFKKSLWGVGYSALIAGLVFLPFLIAGTAQQTFLNAYINTLGAYPQATINAANLWFVWAGNMAADDINLLTGGHGGILVVKNVGMLLFACVCATIMLLGLRRQIIGQMGEPTAAREWLLYTLLISLAFFTLLPAMHERYLLPSVVVALFYALLAPSGYVLALLLSFIAAANVLLVLPLSGNFFWKLLALTSVVLFAALLLKIILGVDRSARIEQKLVTALQQVWLVSVFLVIIVSGFGAFLHHRTYHVTYPELASNQQLLRELSLLRSKQSHGEMAFNKSYDGNVLSVSGKRYGKGIGVHAESQITFSLPVNAQRFNVMVGLDDEVNLGEVEFLLQNGDEVLWRSGPVYGYDAKPIMADVSVQGVRELTLTVLPRGNDGWDHADWINPIVTLSP